MHSNITGYIDVAQIVLYVFFAFFIGLIYYLHGENKRSQRKRQANPLSKTLWSVDDLVAMIDAAAAPAKKRGPRRDTAKLDTN